MDEDARRARELTVTERRYDLPNLRWLLLDQEEEGYANTFTNWTSYWGMMQRYGERAIASATALMIGAETPLSARSFYCFAREQYGADRVHVVDLKSGEDKKRHGQFVYGNAFALPFRDASMDFVHTDMLIHSLRPLRASRRASAKMLVEEIARVLAPGGQLLMHEATYGMAQDSEKIRAKAQAFGDFILACLTQVGVHEGWAGFIPVPREDVTEYLWDPTRSFEGYMVSRNLDSIDVYARKAKVPAGSAL